MSSQLRQHLSGFQPEVVGAFICGRREHRPVSGWCEPWGLSPCRCSGSSWPLKISSLSRDLHYGRLQDPVCGTGTLFLHGVFLGLPVLHVRAALAPQACLSFSPLERTCSWDTCGLSEVTMQPRVLLVQQERRPGSWYCHQ